MFLLIEQNNVTKYIVVGVLDVFFTIMVIYYHITQVIPRLGDGYENEAKFVYRYITCNSGVNLNEDEEILLYVV